MSNRVDSRLDSGSGGNFKILFGHMFIVRAVQHGNLQISLSIKFSKFPPLPELTPESTLLDMRAPKVVGRERAHVVTLHSDSCVLHETSLVNSQCIYLQGGNCL